MSDKTKRWSKAEKSEIPGGPAQTLRRKLESGRPVVFIGAHDGLGALLAEEAGFDGVWAGGFEICASHGVPDASLLSISDHLEAVRIMARTARLPVLVDADAGFGNAINARRATEAFEDAGAAGICLEDNVHPKQNSFYENVRRRLAPVEEHALKVRACCDVRGKDAFLVVARTETLVAGGPMEEALRRGRAYADAGADAILVHSKAATADEVMAFARAWDRPTPLACVPTTYARSSVAALFSAGFRIVIFANQGLRSAVRAMRRDLQTLRRTGLAASIDENIVPMAEIDRLVGVDRLRALERAFLPSSEEETTAGGRTKRK